MVKYKKLPDNSCNGFSLVEILVVVGIISFVGLAIGSLNSQLGKQMAQTASVDQVDLFKRNIVTIVMDSGSWVAIKKANAATGAQPLGKMDCLLGSTSCTDDGTATGNPIKDQLFAVYDAANGLIYDSTNPINGVQREGLRCNTFPSTTCPFRFRIKWTAVCTGACINPLVKINAQLEYNDGTTEQPVLNLNMHSVQDTFRPAL